VTQAVISRLERGNIILPRRTRLEALAAALEVTLGSLLLQSGWVTSEEQAQVDGLLGAPMQPDPTLNDAVLAEVADLQTTCGGSLSGWTRCKRDC
jgi:transcriptional regulator with XRE-family HTH domain